MHIIRIASIDVFDKSFLQFRLGYKTENPRNLIPAILSDG
jgi:hypothetical protein